MAKIVDLIWKNGIQMFADKPPTNKNYETIIRRGSPEICYIGFIGCVLIKLSQNEIRTIANYENDLIGEINK